MNTEIMMLGAGLMIGIQLHIWLGIKGLHLVFIGAVIAIGGALI